MRDLLRWLPEWRDTSMTKVSVFASFAIDSLRLQFNEARVETT